MMKEIIFVGLVGCMIGGASALADGVTHSVLDGHHDRDHRRVERDAIGYTCAFQGPSITKVPLFCSAEGRLEVRRERERRDGIGGESDEGRRDRDRFRLRENHLSITCNGGIVYDDGAVVRGLGLDGLDDGRGYEDGRRLNDGAVCGVDIFTRIPFLAAIHVAALDGRGFFGRDGRFDDDDYDDDGHHRDDRDRVDDGVSTSSPAVLTVNLGAGVLTTLPGGCLFRAHHEEFDERRDEDHYDAPSVAVSPAGNHLN